MKNIVDEVRDLVNTKGPVSMKEIVDSVESDVLSALPLKELEATIYTDLLVDGRFLAVDGKWDLKDNYTMKEVMREQYRSLGEFDDYKIPELEEEEIVEEEEIELKTVLDADEDEEVVVSVNDLDA